MSPDELEDFEPEAKRRRLRKGTHSCWECKRRKVRCTFESATDAVCITCRRRGAKCVSQELPEEPSRVEDSAGRIVRVEALLNQLVKKVDQSTAKDGAQSTSDEGRRPGLSPLTPAGDSEPSPVSTTTQTSITRCLLPIGSIYSRKQRYTSLNTSISHTTLSDSRTSQNWPFRCRQI